MYTGPLRLVRALTVSATCVALSLAAHIVGSGSGTPMVSVVSVVGLLMTTVLMTLVLASFSGRRWTLGRSLVALACGQVALNALFMVLLPAHEHQGSAVMTVLFGGASMALAHGAAALLIGVGIAANDCALDVYFSLATSLVGSGMAVLSPWRQAALIPVLETMTRVGGATGRGGRYARWQRPRILTDLVVVQCLSRRGPPALALAL